MSPSEIVDAILASKCDSILRQPGQPLDRCWVLDDGSKWFGHREIQRAVQDGALVGDLKERMPSPLAKHDWDQRVNAPKRKEAAAKAQRTLRNKPLSSGALRVLGWCAQDWFFASHDFEVKHLRECFRKGLVMWGNFPDAIGIRRGWKTTAKGLDALRKAA